MTATTISRSNRLQAPLCLDPGIRSQGNTESDPKYLNGAENLGASAW